MSDYDRSPDKIPMDKAEKPQDIIMFTLRGQQEAVTRLEALSIINHLSGCLIADEHAGRKFG